MNIAPLALRTNSRLDNGFDQRRDSQLFKKRTPQTKQGRAVSLIEADLMLLSVRLIEAQHLLVLGRREHSTHIVSAIDLRPDDVSAQVHDLGGHTHQLRLRRAC